MRMRVALLSFAGAFLLGLALARVDSIVDCYWPSFTHQEATARVGESVRHRRTEKFRLMKCSGDLPCKEVAESESGVVVATFPVPDGGYFLEVEWGQSQDSMKYVSYVGRYSYREAVVAYSDSPGQ